MITYGAKDVGKTALHRNPFALLGATYTSSRSEIIELAEQKSFSLDETVVQEARRALTTPSLRLQAEIGWLPDFGPGQIDEILSPRGTDRVLRTGEYHPLTHANLVAAGLESLIHNPVQSSAVSQLHLLAASVQKVNVEVVQTLLNKYRATAGFPEIEAHAAREAISTQFNYYKDVGSRFLSRYARFAQEEVLGELLDNAPVTLALIHEWADFFHMETKAEHDSLIGNVDDACRRVELRLARRATAIQVSAGLDDLIQSLHILDKSIYPIWRSHLNRGLPYWRFSDTVAKVRNLIVRAANEYQDFHRALKHIQALLRLKSLDESLKRTLNQDQMQVVEGIYEPGPQPPVKTPFGRPTHASAVPVSTRDGTNWTRWIGRLVTLAIVIWIGSAIFGDNDSAKNAGQSTRTTSSASSGSVCQGVDLWFEQTNRRFDQAVTFYNDLFDVNLSAHPYLEDATAGQIRLLRIEQQQAVRPAAGRDFDLAVIRYLDLMIDTLEGRAPSGAQWDLENDRLFNSVQRESNDLINQCD